VKYHFRRPETSSSTNPFEIVGGAALGVFFFSRRITEIFFSCTGRREIPPWLLFQLPPFCISTRPTASALVRNNQGIPALSMHRSETTAASGSSKSWLTAGMSGSA
jgi:hypothetical protein